MSYNIISMKHYTLKCKGIPTLSGRIQWIYTVLNTPSSSGSGFSGSAVSGKDPISHGPIFQAAPLHIVVGFF